MFAAQQPRPSKNRISFPCTGTSLLVGQSFFFAKSRISVGYRLPVENSKISVSLLPRHLSLLVGFLLQSREYPPSHGKEQFLLRKYRCCNDFTQTSQY